MNNKPKIIALFSGQGSHYRGMGKGLFESNPIFRDEIIKADSYVQKLIGRSLINELFSVTDNMEWDDLLVTHPAIIAVENALFQMMKKESVLPDYVLGNSLGEYSALIAAGMISLEDGLEICIEQAKLILKHRIEGGMTTVINSVETRVNGLYEKYNLTLVSDNFIGHYTLSGDTTNLHQFEVELQRQSVQFVRLNVAHPFHSNLMDSIKNEYLQLLSYYSLQEAKDVSFISGIYKKEMFTVEAEYFWDVTRNYTNFSDTIMNLEEKGRNYYLDLGPSGTMATFIKYSLSDSSLSKVFSIMSPFHQDLRNFNHFTKQLLVP